MTGHPLRVMVSGIGLLGPGFDGWASSREILAGNALWQAGSMPRPPVMNLPPAERRRCPEGARFALAVAQEALEASGLRAEDVATVFAASDVDGQLTHAGYEALASEPPKVSPIRFQNSVHNAAAGYWSIATGSRRASTSISAYDWTFAAALLEATIQACMENSPVLLVSCDLPSPPPLSALRPIDMGLAVALLLRPCERPGAIAMLEISLEAGGQHCESLDTVPVSMRRTPSARAIPLLSAIAAGRPDDVVIDYLDGLVLRAQVR